MYAAPYGVGPIDRSCLLRSRAAEQFHVNRTIIYNQTGGLHPSPEHVRPRQFPVTEMALVWCWRHSPTTSKSLVVLSILRPPLLARGRRCSRQAIACERWHTDDCRTFANNQLKDNLNPVGRVYYSFSTLLCTPCSRSQEGGLCLGAQAGENRIREVITAAGFSRFRRATETPFNIVYEARP